MALTRHRAIPGAAALAVVAMLAAAGPAVAAGDAEADSLAEAWEEDVEQQHGWLRRTVHRFFQTASTSSLVTDLCSASLNSTWT